MNTNKGNRERGKFLDFLLSSAPRIESPPFFAARVANIVRVERYSFARSLQAVSRRLVPFFMAILVVVCIAAHQLTSPDPLIESAMFYEEEHLPENISLEYVVESLALLPGEENENH